MRKGYLYIALTTALFSSMEVALKSVAGRFDPVQLTLLRFLAGGLLLLPFALRQMRSRVTRATRQDLGYFALLGFICVVVSMTIYQMAIALAKASIVAILFSCNPVFVVPLAALGIVLTLISAAVFALYTVLGKSRSPAFGGLATASLSFIFGSLELLALVFVFRIPAAGAWLGRLGLGAFAGVPLLKGLGLRLRGEPSARPGRNPPSLTSPAAGARLEP